MRLFKHGILYGFALGLSGVAFAVPKAQTTSLPITQEMTGEEHKAMLSFIASLTVYQDHADPNQYYYLPPLRAVEGIAATKTLMTRRLESLGELNRIDSDVYSAATRPYYAAQTRYNRLADRRATLADPNSDEYRIVTEMMQAAKAEFEAITARADQGDGLVPGAVLNARNERFAFVAGSTGISIDGIDFATASGRAKAASRVGRSQGALMTTNIFGGLTGEEKEHIRKYRTLRAESNLPSIKISLLPVENVTWGSLTETLLGREGNSEDAAPIYRQIKGGGNLVGATVSMDFTVDGAEGLATNAGPVILPIYAQSELLQKYPALTAELKCEFTTGFTLKGRTDVRDGLVVYDNDITTKLVAKDVASTNQPCVLKIEGGSGDEAQFVALQAAMQSIKDRLTGLFLERSNLAAGQKKDYWDSVQKDIESNRRNDGGDDCGGGIRGFICRNETDITLSSLAARASNFHWHTNIQDIEFLSQLKWEEKIVLDPSRRVRLDLPTNICVAYNPRLDGYTQCSDAEMLLAGTLSEQGRAALGSEICDGASSAVECGELRAAGAPVNPSTGNVTGVDLPDEI